MYAVLISNRIRHNERELGFKKKKKKEKKIRLRTYHVAPPHPFIDASLGSLDAMPQNKNTKI